MKVEHSDTDTLEFLDSAGMAFMTLTVHRLNAALIEQGIADSGVREEICSKFLFGFAYHHDAGWLMQDDRQVFPMVVLAERRKPGPDENLGKIRTLHVPTQASSWHEYACGVVSEYFSANESAAGIRRGSYENGD